MSLEILAKLISLTQTIQREAIGVVADFASRGGVTMIFHNLKNSGTDPRGNKYKEYATGVNLDGGRISFHVDEIPQFKGRVEYFDGKGFTADQISSEIRQLLERTLESFFEEGKHTTIYWRVTPEVEECNTTALDSRVEGADRKQFKSNPDAFRLYFRLSYYND